MKKSTALSMNFIFLVVIACGSLAIYLSDKTGAQEIFYLPAGLTLFYGLVTGLVLRSCDDSAQAEHFADTVYFTGFIFTLVSLSVLFYRFYSGSFESMSADLITDTFFYIGVSVTTSVAGVLLKNIVRASWLRLHPETGDQLERTYQLLKETAESFQGGYAGVFDSIGSYLEERRENARLFDREEKAFLASFEAFGRTLTSFNTEFEASISELNNELRMAADAVGQQRQEIGNLIEAGRDTEEAARSFSRGISEIPLDELCSNMGHLRRESQELDAVLDSIIRIIELKVEKVG